MMDISIRIFLVGIFGVIIGMIGAFAMVEMIDRSNNYFAQHPPDEKNKNNKGGNSDDS